MPLLSSFPVDAFKYTQGFYIYFLNYVFQVFTSGAAVWESVESLESIDPSVSFLHKNIFTTHYEI